MAVVGDVESRLDSVRRDGLAKCPIRALDNRYLVRSFWRFEAAIYCAV